MKKIKLMLVAMLVLSVLAISLTSIITASAFSFKEETVTMTDTIRWNTESKYDSLELIFYIETGELIFSGYGEVGDRDYEKVMRGETPIKTITFESGIYAIGENAFSGITTLTTVNFCDTINSIGANAFKDCTALTDFELPKNIWFIGESAFENCNSLTKIDLDGNSNYYNYLTISTASFKNCINLSEIYLNEYAYDIQKNAFENTAYYNNPENWEGSLLYLDDHLIAAKDAGEPVIIKGSTKSITTWLFSDFERYFDVVFEEGITEIESGLFMYCGVITYATLPNSLVRIGSYAFYGSSIKQINIPDSVMYIGAEAFGSTQLLYNLNYYDAADVLYIGRHLIKAPDNLVDYEIRKDTLTIADEAFICNYNLKNISLLGDIRVIGEYAFYGCKNLQLISLSENVVYIGYNAFSDCYNLTDIIYFGSPKQLISLLIDMHDYLLWKNIHLYNYPDYKWDYVTTTTDYTWVDTWYTGDVTTVKTAKKRKSTTTGDSADVSNVGGITFGCSGSFATTGMVVILLAGGLVTVMLKKKKDN